jgi:hypothetical protein
MPPIPIHTRMTSVLVRTTVTVIQALTAPLDATAQPAIPAVAPQAPASDRKRFTSTP